MCLKWNNFYTFLCNTNSILNVFYTHYFDLMFIDKTYTQQLQIMSRFLLFNSLYLLVMCFTFCSSAIVLVNFLSYNLCSKALGMFEQTTPFFTWVYLLNCVLSRNYLTSPDKWSDHRKLYNMLCPLTSYRINKLSLKNNCLLSLSSRHRIVCQFNNIHHHQTLLKNHSRQFEDNKPQMILKKSTVLCTWTNGFASQIITFFPKVIFTTTGHTNRGQ